MGAPWILDLPVGKRGVDIVEETGRGKIFGWFGPPPNPDEPVRLMYRVALHLECPGDGRRPAIGGYRNHPSPSVKFEAMERTAQMVDDDLASAELNAAMDTPVGQTSKPASRIPPENQLLTHACDADRCLLDLVRIQHDIPLVRDHFVRRPFLYLPCPMPIIRSSTH
jgi:hypothetical protein